MTTEAPPGAPPAAPEPPSEPEGGGTMTLLDHLFELRSRVMWSGIGVVLGMVVFVIPPIGFGAIEFLKAPAEARNPDFFPQAITPLENVVTYFRVVLFTICEVVLICGAVGWQIWSLKRFFKEKKVA